MLDSMIYRNIFTSQEMQTIWSDSSIVSTWLRIEQALAQVQAEMGVIPADTAIALEKITINDIEFNTLAEDMLLVGRPIVGFIKQLREYVGPVHRDFVHFGTTTQDIMDTATVLQMQAGMNYVFPILREIITQLELLAVQHAETMMIGRTNGQFAKPITFGFKVQLWAAELNRRYKALTQAAESAIQVQLGGPVGNLEGFDEVTGIQLRKALAALLGLNYTKLAWQNSRDGFSGLVLSLAQLCASLEKIAHNVNLLSSSDIGELYESHEEGKGASSAMAHKRNQRASEFAEALGCLARGRAVQICELTQHEHERSGGVWVSEWVVVPEVFLLASGTLKWSKSLFTTLQVDKSRMGENLKLANEQINHRLSTNA